MFLDRASIFCCRVGDPLNFLKCEELEPSFTVVLDGKKSSIYALQNLQTADTRTSGSWTVFDTCVLRSLTLCAGRLYKLTIPF